MREQNRRILVRPKGLSILLMMIWTLSGCQSTTRVGDRYYQDGRYPEAAAAYRVYLDSGMSDREETLRTLYRLAVIYGTPGSSAYDPQRSIETLETLLSVYPGSAYAPEASLLRNLQVKIADLAAEVTADRVRLTELEVDLAEREHELARLDRELGERDEQIEALRDSIPPLRLEIRDLIHELAGKQEELEQLERLKAIDLDQPPP